MCYKPNLFPIRLVQWMLAITILLFAASTSAGEDSSAYHVHPGQNIQEAIEKAASDPARKKVLVHAGTYRPAKPAQALVWFNTRHNGITLEAIGDVVLTAANPQVGSPDTKSFPAIVNHVVYFGDGVGRDTVLRGFKITGANHFVTRSEQPGPIQPPLAEKKLRKALFFYADGGAIKVFGRSYPTIDQVEIYENYASPCGGGISIEHRTFNRHAVLITNSIFRQNSCQITGSAIDVLPDSAAAIINCLFVANIANTGVDYVSGPGDEYNKQHGSGALTVFPGARVQVRRCTFTGNWNGADDKGSGNLYADTIFWQNNAGGGIAPGSRYELDILDASRVKRCFFGGDTPDLRKTIDRTFNIFDADDPDFDLHYVPRNPAYAEAGYRPVAIE